MTAVERCIHKLDLRERIIILHNDGFSPAEISRDLDISRATVYRWLARWHEDNTLQDRYRSGGPRRTTSDQDQSLWEAASSNPQTNAVALKKKLKLKVSATTVRTRLREAGIHLHPKLALREKIIKLHVGGLSPTEIKNKLRISRSTVYLWLRRWYEDASLADRPSASVPNNNKKKKKLEEEEDEEDADYGTNSNDKEYGNNSNDSDDEGAGYRSGSSDEEEEPEFESSSSEETVYESVSDEEEMVYRNKLDNPHKEKGTIYDTDSDDEETVYGKITHTKVETVYENDSNDEEEHTLIRNSTRYEKTTYDSDSQEEETAYGTFSHIDGETAYENDSSDEEETVNGKTSSVNEGLTKCAAKSSDNEIEETDCSINANGKDVGHREPSAERS